MGSNIPREEFQQLSGIKVFLNYNPLILVLMSFHPQVDASHFLECIPWLLVFVGFFQTTGMFMASVLPKSGIQIFIQCIVMFFIFAGMFPLEEVLDGFLKTFLSTNWFQVYMLWSDLFSLKHFGSTNRFIGQSSSTSIYGHNQCLFPS